MHAPSDSASLPWWKHLNSYHWFVFFVASAAWCFDCLDQQLFILARDNAIKALSPGVDSLTQGKLSGWAMSVFVAGWATGGLIFGAVGDRIGRAKTLALTVLIYSLFTGLSSFAKDVTQFMIFRALTGLGVGGVFGLAVALVADALPEVARPKALGMLQALSAVGNVTAGLCAMALSGTDPMVSWKYLFWIGSIPAFLCIFIMARLKEPEKWVAAKAASVGDRSKAMGSYTSLFGDARWRKSALLGMMLCVAAVVGLWGVGFFSNKLVGPAIAAALAAEKSSPAEIAAGKQWWSAANLIVMNIGAFLGMITFSKAAHNFGRKPVFAVAFVLAMIATIPQPIPMSGISIMTSAPAANSVSIPFSYMPRPLRSVALSSAADVRRISMLPTRSSSVESAESKEMSNLVDVSRRAVISDRSWAISWRSVSALPTWRDRISAIRMR